VAVPQDLGPNRLKDFVGGHILVVVPDSALQGAPLNSNNLGGIMCRGVGTYVGLQGLSTSGYGVRGEGAFGVVGDGSKGAGVPGRHKASGEGVRGEGSPRVLSAIAPPTPAGERDPWDPLPAFGATARADRAATAGTADSSREQARS